MALTKCKECGGQVSSEATACPHCGAKPPKRTSRAGWLFLVFVIVLVVGIKLGSPETPPTPPMTPEQKAEAIAKAQMEKQQSEAKWQCRQFVERSLKAPATADFQNYREFTAWGTDDGPYGVKGYVDAQNSFGAKLRTEFTCSLEKKGGTWRLIELRTKP